MDSLKRLACNIRKFRKLHGMTQLQLAQKLFVTAQNVSKWELGISAPDIANLCKLSEVLCVSADRLLGIAEMETKTKVMIAIDGGGTKTEFIMFSEHGEIMSRLVLQGSNPNSCGMNESLLVLKKGIDSMLSIHTDVYAIYAGIAGSSLENNRKKMMDFLKSGYPYIKSDIQTDILNVVYTERKCDNCIVVICGTGSVVCANKSDGLYRLGGWGYLFDMGGSGYDMGRDVIQAALAENEGIGEETYITKLVEKRLGGNVGKKLGVFYSSDKEYIATFASDVFTAYRYGDKVAERIIDKNMARLAFLINRAAEKYDCKSKVIISGGLTSQKEILRPFLESKINSGLKLVFCSEPQIMGASAACMRTFAKLDENFRDHFESNYYRLLEEERDA